MDDAEFLAAAAALLPPLVNDDIKVIEVRLDRSRSWLRAEARFEVGEEPVYGSALVPLDSDWRYLSGYEFVDDYADLLAQRICSAAVREVMSPSAGPAPASSPEEVALRWQWLLERLALNGQVVKRDAGSVRVLRGDGGGFTVLVTPEQWARIAEPADPHSDDPQDFNQLFDEEAFLVFYEDSLEWSIRAELPPVRFGAEIKRSFREAKERGEDMSRYGWFAHRPLDDQPDLLDERAE